ncbi:MAG: hypothetical protein MZV63_36975 [Marinilabiliales bacterium]|nr:hypothetical protein [Marinilabiliales bacterium]
MPRAESEINGLHELLEHITEGKGTLADLDRLRNMSLVIKDTSLCGLGQTSPNPVLSTLDNFRDEYVAHVTDKKCPAGKCKRPDGIFYHCRKLRRMYCMCKGLPCECNHR